MTYQGGNPQRQTITNNECMGRHNTHPRDADSDQHITPPSYQVQGLYHGPVAMLIPRSCIIHRQLPTSADMRKVSRTIYRCQQPTHCTAQPGDRGPHWAQGVCGACGCAGWLPVPPHPAGERAEAGRNVLASGEQRRPGLAGWWLPAPRLLLEPARSSFSTSGCLSMAHASIRNPVRACHIHCRLLEHGSGQHHVRCWPCPVEHAYSRPEEALKLQRAFNLLPRPDHARQHEILWC